MESKALSTMIYSRNALLLYGKRWVGVTCPMTRFWLTRASTGLGKSLHSRGDVYTLEIVRIMAENYQPLQLRIRSRFIHVHLIDFQRAFSSLKLRHKQAILLVGMLGYTERATAKILGVSKTSVHKRYHNGLTLMTSYLNGDV